MEIKSVTVKSKPDKCPQCGFEHISTLLYGVCEIDQKLQKDIDDKKVLLGGCSLLKNSPLWFCSKCETEIYLGEKN